MNKYQINKNLVFVIFVAVLFQIFLFMQKENLHIDEILSFIATNNEEGIYLSDNWSNMDNNYVEGEYFTKRLTRQPNSSILSLWNRISQDNHMPIYFSLLYLFDVFNNSVFNPIFGKILNVFVLIFLLVGFYKLTMLVFNNKNTSVIATAIFAFMQSVLGLEVYIRMYLLLMAFSTWLIYFVGDFFIKKDYKKLSLIFVLVFLTILTHYYSLIFCFLLAFFVCVILTFDKNYRQMFWFSFTMLLAVFLAYLVFPSMIDTGFHGERGSQFWLILDELKENPIKIIKQQIPLFIDTIFINFWCFITFFVCLLVSIKSETLQNKFILILFLVFIGYGFLTSLVMPVMLYYQIRYFAPIIPIFVLLFVYIISAFGDKYKVSLSKIFLFLVFIMFVVCVKNIIWQKSPFYMHGTNNSRKMENLVKNADIWWGFGGGQRYAWMIHLYVDKLATASKIWNLADYDHPDFIKFSNQEINDKKYAYLFMPITQEQAVDGAIEWVKRKTGRRAYYLFTSKSPSEVEMVFEASVYLVCPY